VLFVPSATLSAAAATLLRRQSTPERSAAGSALARDPAHRAHPNRPGQVLVGLAARVQGVHDVHPRDDAAERGEALAVGVAAAAEVELGLGADADEELGRRGSGLRARHRDGAVDVAQPVCRVVSWAIGGSGGGLSSGRFIPHCTTSILFGVSGA
jgi:hypothetical protein